MAGEGAAEQGTGARGGAGRRRGRESWHILGARARASLHSLTACGSQLWAAKGKGVRDERERGREGTWVCAVGVPPRLKAVAGGGKLGGSH